MVRPPSFDMNGIKSGVWSKEEDDVLRAFIQKHGHHNWQKLPFLAGLARSGKSCRLRWVNYLQPGLKKGNFSKEEVDVIIRLHNQIGNRWSAIAEKLPGRSDNDIKNHWHAHIKKRGKRCRFVTRPKMEDEEESLETNCSKKSDHQEQIASFNEAYDDTFQFNNFGVGHNDTPTFSDSSSCFSQINIAMPEEEFGDSGLWHNATPTYDDYTQLNIHLPPLISEEEFSSLGLFNNDTPTFSDSTGVTYDHNHIDFPPFPEEQFGLCHNHTLTSFSGGLTYDDNTCFTQLHTHLPQQFSDYGLYQNHTPPFSDSSHAGITPPLINHGEYFGFNLLELESLWYFGEDGQSIYMS